MIRKAVIPIAGRGTRLYPLTKVIPKAMLPLPRGDQCVLPIVHWICAEAASAGIEQVLLMVALDQREIVQRYFAEAAQDHSPALPENIEFAIQPAPKGLGDAVRVGADFVGGEAFLLLLGDHVYVSSQEKSCAAQVVEVFAKFGGAAMVGMQPVGLDELPHVGIARGEPVDRRVYRCMDLIEKPDPAVARNRLVTPNLPAGEFLAHCGIYVFASEIFDCLTDLSRLDQTRREELQLTDAQALLLKRHPQECFLLQINGRAYDAGSPASYAKAFAAFAETCKY